MSAADGVDAIIDQWRCERPDLPVQAMATIGRLGRLTLAMEDAINATFVRHGLRRGEFDVLAALRRSGEPFELSPSVLADTLLLSRAGMTGRLDRLESAGLVRRIADVGDRRSVLVALTERGRALIDVVVTEHAHNEERLLSVLPIADRAHLDRILRWLQASLDG